MVLDKLGCNLSNIFNPLFGNTIQESETDSPEVNALLTESARVLADLIRISDQSTTLTATNLDFNSSAK